MEIIMKEGNKIKKYTPSDTENQATARKVGE